MKYRKLVFRSGVTGFDSVSADIQLHQYSCQIYFPTQVCVRFKVCELKPENNSLGEVEVSYRTVTVVEGISSNNIR